MARVERVNDSMVAQALLSGLPLLPVSLRAQELSSLPRVMLGVTDPRLWPLNPLGGADNILQYLSRSLGFSSNPAAPLARGFCPLHGL